LQEGKESVGGLVAAGSAADGGGLVQGLLLEGHVGVHVDLRGGGGLVAEPQRADGDVHAGAQQAHRCGVAQDVGRAALSSAFGVSEGPAPDLFLIALAALDVLAGG
jgi:hypothetical protein